MMSLKVANLEYEHPKGIANLALFAEATKSRNPTKAACLARASTSGRFESSHEARLGFSKGLRDCFIIRDYFAD